MKLKTKTLYSDLQRHLSNEEIAYKVYLYWAFIVVVFIGIFGIFLLLKTINSNLQLGREVKDTNIALREKIQEINEIKSSLDDIGDNVLFLDFFLPDRFELHVYMIDFVFLAGGSGFVVERFAPGNIQGNKVDLSVSIVGEGNLKELVRNLEMSNRISEITNLLVFKGSEYPTTSMQISTYIMEK
jgi:hypothetical protein